MSTQAFAKRFTQSAGFILAVAGVAKLLMLFTGAKVLAVRDPIFGLHFRELLAVVGIVELIAAAICIFASAGNLGPTLVAWLSTSFLFFRLGLWWMGWKG